MNSFELKKQKETEKLNKLYEKKEEIEKKIEISKALIKKYTTTIEQRKFSEIKDVIHSNGISIEEILEAIKTGDLISLQEKINEKNK